jgi:hypothetical protein
VTQAKDNASVMLIKEGDHEQALQIRHGQHRLGPPDRRRCPAISHGRARQENLGSANQASQVMESASGSTNFADEQRSLL